MLPNEAGLTNDDAKRRLAEVGYNILPEKLPPSDLLVFLSQFKNPLVYVLFFAGLITIFLRHFSDSAIIFLAVLLNTVLGFIQEARAGKALYALKKLVTQKAEVVREGKRIKIDSSLLVPQDIVILSQGAKVPADGVLIFANRLYLDEAILTGESVPASKQDGDEVFMGTVVSSGQAMMKITATGAGSRVGGIAQKIQEAEEDTPLGRQLNGFSKKIVILVLCLAAIVFLAGIIRGKELVEMFTTVVALSVSSIPEGLLVSLTVVLAIGMQRILKRRGLVRKLASAETLGGVTTICVDKTGTLTQGKMQVVDVVGDKNELAKQVILANDLDDPLVIAAFEWGRGIIKDFIQEHQRIDSIPFSSKERFFTSLHKWTKNTNMMFVNGAPDVLLRWVDMDNDGKKEVETKINELTSQGRRVIGFARKEMPLDRKELSSEDAKEGLTWVGMLALSDPVRTSVKEAIVSTKEAGIEIIVITGDYSNTSEFVLTELGIPVSKKEILIGDELEKLSVQELSEKVKTIKLFARTTPEQKLKIVEALKKNGEIVAMMGDGVNDAPAIHKADIGIVVNEASDVARESADLVLLDSNFSTIVGAVEEGRSMFENIRKIILYLLSDAFAEIVVIIGGIILGLPLPITAVQIIWINLVSDGFPDLALTVDPKRAEIMKEKPRPNGEQLVNHWMLSLISMVSLVAGGIALSVFIIVYRVTGDIILARSMAFVTLGLNSLSYVFSVRSLMVPFWRNHLFENRWLIIAVAAGFVLQLIPFVSETTRNFFGVTRIGISGWLIAIALSISIFFVIEAFKVVYRFGFMRKLARAY
ncbi:MAG: Calcium-translocating P-type ATPase, PMCA-type [Parcubacteria group bacterium GW2011_GWE1_40_20]|nr:MAG: Calcium-translocating P-type ATPase, PMCA-type [Parcubacteria group bacterium GW2011_GWE1_40_20]